MECFIYIFVIRKHPFITYIIIIFSETVPLRVGRANQLVKIIILRGPTWINICRYICYARLILFLFINLKTPNKIISVIQSSYLTDGLDLRTALYAYWGVLRQRRRAQRAYYGVRHITVVWKTPFTILVLITYFGFGSW